VEVGVQGFRGAMPCAPTLVYNCYTLYRLRNKRYILVIVRIVTPAIILLTFIFLVINITDFKI
jgi:hypothetical protein